MAHPFPPPAVAAAVAAPAASPAASPQQVPSISLPSEEDPLEVMSSSSSSSGGGYTSSDASMTIGFLSSKSI